MPRRTLSALLLVLFAITGQLAAQDKSSPVDTSRGDALLAEYFRTQAQQIASSTFADIHTLADWEARKGELRRQLAEMLGLDPMPERTPLHPVITGTVDHPEFTVENLHFQSRPGLYVTGNLYLPKGLTGPAPTILYVCGHARVREDDVSYGNKVAYQHHGAWFARHGYVCLVIDTLQLGEIEGIHHGTYREGMWWWINRGYTPAGVEAWNCIRSLDYLETRPEVDAARFGVTGRSGGGAYSWWLSALDDRIQVAVPVAGITSLQNHVVDGCVEGHCDCMYMFNTYRWDFPVVAALVAPRPLLISNTDKDGIFPLDGVVDVYWKTKRIYELYGATDKLGLQICEGPHKDTQQLRVHAFQWMNRWLKHEEPLIEKPAVPFFAPPQLKVFNELPEDQINTRIHETFVPLPRPIAVPRTETEWTNIQQTWMADLREHVFRGWPGDDDVPPLDLQIVRSEVSDGVRLSVCEYTSQEPYRLALFALQREDATPSAVKQVTMQVCDESDCDAITETLAPRFPELIDTSAGGSADDRQSWDDLRGSLQEPGSVRVYVVPRGVGPTRWTTDEKERTHIERRFVLLGQTVDGMRTYDVRRAIQAVRERPDWEQATLSLSGKGRARHVGPVRCAVRTRHHGCDARCSAAGASGFADATQHLAIPRTPAGRRPADGARLPGQTAACPRGLVRLSASNRCSPGLEGSTVGKLNNRAQSCDMYLGIEALRLLQVS